MKEVGASSLFLSLKELKLINTLNLNLKGNELKEGSAQQLGLTLKEYK